jgi:hypothetical protein
MKSFVFHFGKAAPLLGLLAGLTTLFGTLFLSTYYGHLPVGLRLPFISLNGVQNPEYILYSIGFSTTGLCILSSACFARNNFFPLVENSLQCYARTSFWSATMAGLGLLLQAVVPLQSDILAVIDGTSSLRMQSIVHQSGALILFLAGYVHCVSTDILLWKTRTLPNNFKSRWCKTVLTVLAISPFFIAFLPHPATGGSKDLDDMTEGAIGQWICVLSLLFFFASYHVEFGPIRFIGTTYNRPDQEHDLRHLRSAVMDEI